MHTVPLLFSLLLVCSDPMTDESSQSAGKAPHSPRNKSTSGVKTMGGRQFWGDVRFFHGFRIQKNILTGHFRLLDTSDNRHESGTLEACEKKLEQLRNEKRLPPMSGKAVILIHGIGRSSKSFFGMAKQLADADYCVVGFDYPSTRISIQDSTEFLHRTLGSLKGIESIDIVCHSMGGLLLRAYLQKHKEPRFHRAVMLGVPNKGAQMADFLKNNRLFKAVLGPAGQQLVTGKDGLISQLPAPDFEFGILAGGRSAAKGYNPLLPGDNDGTVTVSSTRLPGATDFILLPVIHSFLMTDQSCISATLHFLKHGHFSPDRPASPVSGSDITIIR